MIDGIGPSAKGRIALERASIERTQRASKAQDTVRHDRTSAPASLAYEMMSAVGPPVDVAKVAALRVAIANGQYPVDPQKIAQRMVELDLPAQSEA